MHEAEQLLAARLSGRRVLLAYGLLGEMAAAMHRLGMDYMVEQRLWLTRLGAEAQVVALPTGAPVSENAAVLAEALRAGPPALLIGHSKGGLDALAALLLPGAAHHCNGFIALQSPFWGSPIADAVCRARLLHRAVHGALRLLRLGTGAGITDLTTTSRRHWMAEHASGIADLLRRVPVITTGSVLREGATGNDAAYLPGARWMWQRGIGANDGLVPLASTHIPGARHVQFDGGHRALVTIGGTRDPIGALRGLLLELPI